MKVTRLNIPEVLLVEPKKFGDERGFFSETYRRSALADFGFNRDFVQDNHSFSARKGVLRGLHFQSPPHAQDKLVRVVRGAVLDVAVDARRGSPSYGEWVSAELSADNWRQLFVPAGFLHAFVTLTSDVEFLYKVSDVYAPECDGGVIWNDPDLAIDWGIAEDEVILSEKDAGLPRFRDFQSPFQYSG